MKSILVAALGIALAGISPAQAWKTPLQPYQGLTKVIVWKSLADEKKAEALSDAGANVTQPGLFKPLIACIVDKDTLAATLDDLGHGYMHVEVIEGASAGCEGVVPVDATGMNGA